MTNIWFVILCSHGIQHSISVLAQNLIRDLSFDGMEQNWFLVLAAKLQMIIIQIVFFLI